MKRKIIHIDEEKCSGCGACAAACHEGAIGMVNGKARLLRDDYCDGLGDCLPACPANAITFEDDLASNPPRSFYTADVIITEEPTLGSYGTIMTVIGDALSVDDTPAQVEALETGLETYARVIRHVIGVDLGTLPGAGASGGLGAGLVAFAGATLHPRFQIMLEYLDFDRLLSRANLVITAEGSLDGQSPYGKVPCEVSRRAEALGIPTIALAGTIGKGAQETFAHGISAFASIVKRPCSLEEAIAQGDKLLCRAAEDAMRMLLVGERMVLRARAA